MEQSPRMTSSTLLTPKQPVYRVKTGCLKCRSRKKKCDERKPTCRACERNKLACQWPATATTTTFIQIENPVKKSSGKRINGLKKSNRRGDEQRFAVAESSSCRSISIKQEEKSALPSPPSSPESSDSPPFETVSPVDLVRRESCFSTGTEDVKDYWPNSSQDHFLQGSLSPSESSISHSAVSTKVLSKVTRNLAVLPGHEASTFQLLSHYMTKTADCMSNGSTSINPFLTQLIPLAFSSELILQLILTQSAAHRAVKMEEEFGPLAHNHYTKSISLFRQYIDDYIGGKEESPFILTVATLIMCFTETTKGDIHGAIFDHLSAASSLLACTLTREGSSISLDLRNFLVEYYTYAATSSLISIDCESGYQFPLSPDIEQSALRLVESHYLGHMCGSWIELLLLIPRIFELACRWRAVEDSQSTENDDTFFALQSQIQNWTPYHGMDINGSLTGLIYQNAILLYLLTSSDRVRDLIGDTYDSIIQKTVDEALSWLLLFSPCEQINTDMCWPLAVIGSCITDETQQQIIRHRLLAMYEAMGLGNMKQTLTILEIIWQKPVNERGPWTICRVMEAHQIRISFA